MFLLLNFVMLYSVVKTRFVIKSMPNLFPNENLILVHVLLFTVVNALWVADRVYGTRRMKAYNAYLGAQTDENNMNWILACSDALLPLFAYKTANNLLNLFMLYMLHQFSVF